VKTKTPSEATAILKFFDLTISLKFLSIFVIYCFNDKGARYLFTPQIININKVKKLKAKIKISKMGKEFKIEKLISFQKPTKISLSVKSNLVYSKNPVSKALS
jgi:hypothetical protein